MYAFAGLARAAGVDITLAAIPFALTGRPAEMAEERDEADLEVARS